MTTDERVMALYKRMAAAHGYVLHVGMDGYLPNASYVHATLNDALDNAKRIMEVFDDEPACTVELSLLVTDWRCKCSESEWITIEPLTESEYLEAQRELEGQ